MSRQMPSLTRLRMAVQIPLIGPLKTDTPSPTSITSDIALVTLITSQYWGSTITYHTKKEVLFSCQEMSKQT